VRVVTDDKPRRATLTRVQWVELWVFAVVIWTQVILQLVFDMQVIAFLVGLIGIGLIIHMVTWMRPLWRSGGWRRRS
jgi:hypothetical protein